MAEPVPLLEVREAWRTFGSGPAAVSALRGVSLHVAPGESVAVTGRSGSGKSTLLNVLGLLEGLTSGTYLVDGADTSTMPGRDLDALRARLFGFVFQSFHLVPYLTTRENVELGLTYDRRPRRERAQRIDALLDQVGLAHRRDAVVSTLSGGERQRTAVARALVRRPAVLLADEPTGNLDEASAADVLALFEQVREAGVAVVVVTHDAPTAARAQREYRMRDGQVVT